MDPNPSHTTAAEDNNSTIDDEHDAKTKKITVSWARAVVGWCIGDNDHQLRQADPTNSKIQFHITLDNKSQRASYQLRIPIITKRRTYAYVLIPPEQVNSLSCESFNHGPEAAALGTSTIRFQFTLEKSATLVVPVQDPNESSQAVIATLQTFLRQTVLSVSIPAMTLSMAEARYLCTATSTKGLLHSNPRLAPERLYHGGGGKILSPSDLGTPPSLPTIPAGSPPSYGEAGPSPPPAASPPTHPLNTKKRSRQDSITDTTDVEAICAKMLKTQAAVFHASLNAMETSFTKRLGENHDCMADMERRVKQTVRGLRDHLDVVEDRLVAVQKGIDEQISAEVQERWFELRDDMEDHVDGEVLEFKEKIRTDLQNAFSAIEF